MEESGRGKEKIMNTTQNQRGNSVLNSELKPCPFCGGKAKVKVCDGSGSFFADIGTEMYQGRKMTHCLVLCERWRGVFNAWNRRATDERAE
jgi:hypothetical protein